MSDEASTTPRTADREPPTLASEHQSVAAEGTWAPMFSAQQVTDALNRAADDILDAVDAGDEGLRDAMNLVVNATAAYLTGQAHNLLEVVRQGYENDYPTVLSWIEVAVR
ncbi:hypothetical protein ACQEVZ_55445 [Dactylosporangium sp. CA-152071]|uniref:hypothetical protein n=1 Tax=Dactylosporangium sp. CA-152071 TaxID=3239933 RepID=UPI003D944D48